MNDVRELNQWFAKSLVSYGHPASEPRNIKEFKSVNFDLMRDDMDRLKVKFRNFIRDLDMLPRGASIYVRWIAAHPVHDYVSFFAVTLDMNVMGNSPIPFEEL